MAYPRVPAKVKALRGNPGKRKLGQDVDGAALTKVPACPAWLDRDARWFFRFMGRECIVMGLLTQADVPALIMAAALWGRWVQAERDIKLRGPVLTTASGAEVINPYQTISARTIDKLAAVLSQFGGTPAARTKFLLQNQEEPLDIRAVLLGKLTEAGVIDAEARPVPAADEAAELRELHGLLEG